MFAAHTPAHGLAYAVYALLQRVCGADVVITPAKYGSFDVMSREEQLENIDALLRPLPFIKPAFPAFCGAQSPATVPMLRRDTGGHGDFMVIAGSSLYDHPQGPRAGAQALRAALNADWRRPC